MRVSRRGGTSCWYDAVLPRMSEEASISPAGQDSAELHASWQLALQVPQCSLCKLPEVSRIPVAWNSP